MNKRIIVTGGAGFIGSALCRYLIESQNVELLNIDKLTYAANLDSLKTIDNNERYQFLHADITDADAMRRAIADFDPDAIIHLAAESHVDRSISGAGEFIQTNIIGTFNLLEAARHFWDGLIGERKAAFRFLHVSTDEVYGSLSDTGLFKETTAYDPSSPYSASKAASDHLVIAWYRTYGFPALISNCSNNYGPFQFPEKLIPLVILNALEGRDLPVYGDGKNLRDWLFVDDHVRALWTILTKGRVGEKYNVGGRNELTNLDVVHRICDLVDKNSEKTIESRSLIKFVADRPGHDQRYAIDATKLETELGWRAQETFETGLEKTVLWYLSREDWWYKLRKDVYDGGRLGLLKTTNSVDVQSK
ncbi:dTDP-glucose 4,6-dehydratase [Ahrensia sp. 13_GOM-1096m]|uniref:dTDP-glucose 4,6-dehydratase n=1 Tax=Ahrensia sp. 13_GOM-1096m TaxID=1380380 RepID=UPI00054E370E|nr:dTDP-glucose 4,6-dehydratase [Ahrensia sp. 13_GOM-1096m]